jgi:hypothetical protein
MPLLPELAKALPKILSCSVSSQTYSAKRGNSRPLSDHSHLLLADPEPWFYLKNIVMKSIQLRDSFGIDSLVLADLPQPAPGPGEILIKVNAASLNYRDLLVVDGTFFPDLPFPFVPV